MAGVVVKGRFPRRRLVQTVAANLLRYLFQGAARSWARNAGGTAPALGSMTLLLVMSGLVGLTGFALHNLEQVEAAQASLLHVYLRDDAANGDVISLENRLSSDPRVSAIDAVVRVDAAVDPVYPTSYDRGAYQRIQAVLFGAAVAGIAFLGLLGFVAVMVTMNSIKIAIHARRDEITIMQLVGAPRWMVRGPFVVEGAITGALAGAVAGAITFGLTLTAISTAAGAFTKFAPGVTVTVAGVAAAMVVLVGLALGSGSSLISLRRHMES